MSNLGSATLNDLFTHRSDVLAERAYSPWSDMEYAFRSAHLPLYSLESKHSLSAIDILGVSLPYETHYAITLNILDHAGIP